MGGATRLPLIAVALAFLFGPAAAEVPGHNPDLDSRCKPGFQWSRKTVACEQANCPPGAGRTYTLECSCGEAWNKPFRTCMEGGLATHCVAKGQSCGEVLSGFDPISGGCKDGFEKGDDGACQPAFPEKLTCTVQKLDGTPIAGHEITFAEWRKDLDRFSDAQKVTTGADGSLEVAPANRRAEQVMLRIRGLDGYPMQSLQIKVDDQPGSCVFKVTNDADGDAFILDQYEELLGAACLDADTVAKIRNVSFLHGQSVTTPQYDDQANAIKIGAATTWDEQEKTLFHEFGHAISDMIIDPSWGFIKGVPMVGKYVGGEHANWAPNEQKDGWGPDVDAEELAFEEGLADFLAMLRYHAAGESYQADFETDARALAALKEHGADTGSRMEGVVTRLLWELYADELAKGPEAAGRVMGDLIATINHEKDNDMWGYSARTLPQFIANKARRDREAKPDACTVKAGNLGALAGKYGIKGGPAVHVAPTGADDAARQRARDAAAKLGWQPGQGTIAPKPGQDYKLPAGAAHLTFETFDADFAMSGRTRVIKVSPDRASHIRLDGSNMFFVGEGLVEVKNADVTTPHGTVKHEGTSYVVDVTAEQTKVAVAHGSVEAAIDGAPPLALAAGEATVIEAGATSLEKSDGDALLEKAQESMQPADEADEEGGGWPDWAIHLPWIGILALIPVVLLVMRR